MKHGLLKPVKAQRLKGFSNKAGLEMFLKGGNVFLSENPTLKHSPESHYNAIYILIYTLPVHKTGRYYDIGT